MPISWLANADHQTAWAHKSWPEFASLPDKDSCLVILPVHGFADYGPALPLDQEELLGSELLRQAVLQVKTRFSLLVMPPLRFVLAARGEGFLGLDAETAHSLALTIAREVKASGFTKLVFFNTSSTNAPFVATVAIDARAELGLRTYIINTQTLGLALAQPAELAAKSIPSMANSLASLLVEIRLHQSTPLRAPEPVPSLEDRASDSAPLPFPSPHPLRSHYLAALTRTQLAAMPNKGQIWVIIPTASIEQHGHHLPVGVDSILGQAILTAMIGGLSPSASVLIAPPITYGKSNEHVGFPGTLSIDAKLLRRTLLEVSEQLGELGFQRIILFNTHGGNSAVLHYTAREIREDYGILTLVLRHGSKPELATDQETAWGMHADEWETSLMLACSPELVQMDQAVCEYPARLSDPGLLRPEKAPAVFAWLSSDLSKSGVLGDPRPATREKGQLWMEAAGTALRERLREETERRLLGKERQLSLPN